MGGGEKYIYIYINYFVSRDNPSTVFALPSIEHSL